MTGLLAVSVFCCEIAIALPFQQKELEALSQEPGWQKLLHINRTADDQFTTDLIDSQFHLATRTLTPLTELTETLKALLAPAPLGDDHAQCKYPARLLWLKERLQALSDALPPITCPALDQWVSQTRDRKFYLVQVSGYFSNPASAFGHLLFRIGDGKTSRGLTDIGINYGARIPPTDGSLTYIAKGLFGGYTASFTRKQHYLQDKVYANTESRDMWAYRLNLTSAQSKFLIYHLWEIADRQFTYYFLQKNCAYRMAEILEIVLDTELVSGKDVTFAPVKLFNRLHDLDDQHNGRLIDDIEFIPSPKRQVFGDFDSLSPAEVHAANQVLTNGVKTALPVLSKNALDFLLDYLDYKILSSSLSNRQSLRQSKRRIVSERLKINEATLPSQLHTVLNPPGGGSRPGAIQLGFSDSNVTEMEISPFWYGLADKNRGSLIDSSFKVLSLKLQHTPTQLQFKRLTLLEIQDFAPNTVGIYGESSFNWQGSAAVVNRENCDSGCLDGLLTAGIGKSRRFARGNWFATLNGAITTSLRQQDIGVTFGSHYDFTDALRSVWSSRYYLFRKEGDLAEWEHDVELRYFINADHAIGLEWIQQKNAGVQLNYRFKW